MKHWKIWLTLAILGALTVVAGVGWWAWTHWATFLSVLWYGFLTISTCTFVSVVFLLLHPLNFVLKGRLTPRGQRGEVLFSYFFGWVGLGATASPGTQKVWLRVGRREWQLWKNVREGRPSRTDKPRDPSGGDAAPETFAGSPSADAPKAAEVVPPASTTSPSVASSLTTGDHRSASSGADSREQEPVQKPDMPIPERSMSVAEMLARKQADDAAGKTPSASVASPEVPKTEPETEFVEVTAPPVLVTDETGTGGAGGPTGPVGGGPSGSGGDEAGDEKGPVEPKHWLDTLIAKLKRWRRTLAEVRRKVREGWQISRRLWRRFSPLVWRLAGNLWATISLLGPRVWVRHGLDAPEITGMLHGLASMFDGFARAFGARFEAVPVFCVQTIYVKGDVGVSVSSWRSLWCVMRFLGERELWTGSLDLYRWHRDRKASKSQAGAGEKPT